MRALRAAYREGLGATVEALQMARALLASGSEDALQSIRRLSHQLKGSGASYGFPDVTARAEAVLTADPDELIERLDELIVLVVEVADGGEPPLSVLVVEDDPSLSRLLTMTLEGRGHEVTTAGTLADAERLLADRNVSVMVLDLFLPDGDSRRFLIDLKARSGIDPIPIVMISAHGTELAKAECLALGASAFVSKPFQPETLAELLERLATEPAAAARDQSDQEARPDPTPETATILVAEDDDLTAALVVDRLTRDGFRVVHRKDGASALAAASSEPVSLAVLDVKMPKMDGFELLGRLRDLDHFDGVPIVMLTAMGDEHDVVRSFSLGADDYVLKPFSPAELTARVKRLLARR